MTKQVRVKSTTNIAKVAKAFDAAQIRSMKESVGLRLERAFVQRIKQGDSSWAPLSSEWAEIKGHGKPWYYTGRLENAISYDLDGDGVRVGILTHESYSDGETVATVATQLEYGTSKIPARPLFRPVFEEQVKDIVKDAAKDIKKRIKKVL
jgi:phage gpG-like protein